jgi:hypothetical protein
LLNPCLDERLHPVGSPDLPLERLHVATSAATPVDRYGRDAPRPSEQPHLSDDASGTDERRISVRTSTVRETSHVPSETR